MSYAARYGRQPINVLMSMTWRDFRAFHAALNRLVERENAENASEAGGSGA